jgi:hypothetical protein
MKTNLILIVLILQSFVSYGQSVHFSFKDGSHAAYYLEHLDKFTFDGEMMNVHMQGGDIYSWDHSLMDHYRYTDEDVSGLGGNELIKLSPLLVYPNPTSGHIYIDYTLDSKQKVYLEIIDQQGKTIYRTDLGVQQLGKQIVTWSGTDSQSHSVPSGAYICRLVTSKMQVSKRFIIQR